MILFDSRIPAAPKAINPDVNTIIRIINKFLLEFYFCHKDS